ncbi:hypothetical protein BJ170DRAFT_201660 [Xylariales sp. AK1849]|nr:hypothetical protein BJ170DRAFT_201660 [Xylariales sp. AK1849]
MTMLLASPYELQSFTYYTNHHMSTPSSAPSMLNLLSMSYSDEQQQQQQQQASESNEVAQALEIARESPDGAKDPIISHLLETALAHIWGKVQAQPDSYVMSRDEFAVFNYFQHRFERNTVAVAARKRYWDNTTGS